jgi:hypothetical protein
MALIDDFKARFPAPAFKDAVVDTWLPILTDVWPCYYGGGYTACNKEIVLNLVAHLLVMETRPTASSMRETTSRAVGSVSVTNAATKSTSDLNDFFSASKYGQKFMLLTSTRRRAYFV